MNVHVTIARDLVVNLNITLRNAVSESPHSTTVELHDHVYYRNPGSLGGQRLTNFLSKWCSTLDSYTAAHLSSHR